MISYLSSDTHSYLKSFTFKFNEVSNSLCSEAIVSMLVSQTTIQLIQFQNYPTKLRKSESNEFKVIF